ncbi:trifunctional serine/threonine-protein kinase/ATP-binding protein/sensor histidine kinase [Nodularia sphaerocarpa]|uniref:trifunctional serine/threonine-protein kinase/ATP-binding protein/sensor histidine kinase n=1 Tax=Nodularia sphaerocarpa TaxID=137816 RepID=UPI001EFA3F71|nr:ATP-binding sensor histidine kinase [Nodularia sphaerocarpa]MDB9375452.1 AAA family ATPase [Nodularia sphaerocarpa CS-585]MDB9378342.1 AAA family ATPase [Nodularia sphaerocarpa CS-585A2]ULP71987.1 Serine/threonine-protein kinase PknB [Nodularia sphaerocarpa UHCC 0038]
MITVDPTPIIPGYKINSQLYLGYRTLVYRAIREQDQLPVVIKLLTCEYPSFNELLQFRNQYTISKNLNISGIIHPLSLEPYGHAYILVMEDTGLIALGEYIKTTSISLIEILEIAIQLTNILDNLVLNHIIHKDIKPANILINPKTKEVKLIDFSIASLLPKETQELKNPHVLEGTLAYISPEQTGRMNRGIDYRSDFYSLGVTFYELFTGELPFISDDPMELVHCHIAKTPTALVNKKPSMGNREEIPQVVSDIVMKLMAKNAEDRYQSALGLKHDLEKCWDELKNTGKITDFEIGKRDLCDRFLIPEKLYGRKAEVKTLLNACERVSQGKTEMMLVAGFSGIGKTAVVNEIHKPITRQQGYFIKGKFDQFNRNIPFSAFVQALRDLIGQLFSESDAQLAQWRGEIIASVGDNGQVLISVIPELERIIGKQPPTPELSGTAAQNRFNLLFQKFIAVFSTAEHPLVMFLDDLQWADFASLELIKLLMEEQNYLLLLGAYRDNEVEATHPFMLTVEELKKTRKTVNTITLLPLSFGDTNQLVADTLNCPTERSHSLTELIDRKTQGNPFFITQFLKALHEDAQITFNRNQGYWECDLAQIKALSITDDVVEFMAMQLQKLPKKTQNVLKLAACMGNQFDLATLAIVSQNSAAEAAADLWKALQEGLILPQSQVYKFYLCHEQADVNSDNIENVAYRFLHDRVQQAAYSLIPADQKQTTHLTIGKLLLQQTPKAEQSAKIFTLVNQFKLGIDLVQDFPEQQNLAQLNLIAGRRAKSATAYAAAVEYYGTARKLLANHNWSECYELKLAIYTEAIEAAYLNTDFTQMEQLSEMVLEQVTDILDRVPIYETKIQACSAQNQLRLGIDMGVAILHELGIDFPDHPRNEDAAAAIEKTRLLLAEKPPSELIDLPMITDQRVQAAIRILSSMFGIAYNCSPEMLPLIICQQVNLSIEYGNTALSAFAYVTYGLILNAFTGAVETSYEFGQLALNLIEKLSTPELNAKVQAIFNNFIRHWQDPLHTTLTFSLQGYQSGLASGDLEWAVWCICGYSFHVYCTGKELTALEPELARYGMAIAKLKQTTALNYQKTYHQAVLNLLGGSEIPHRLVGNVYNEELMLPQHLEVNDRPAVYHAKINKLILCYLFGEYDQAIVEATIAEEYLDGVPGLFVSVLLPFYDALTHLTVCNQLSPDAAAASLARVQQHQAKLQQWAEYAPSNHLHKFNLVEAEHCRVLGKSYAAMELYDCAIAGAKENGYLQEEALGNELAAKFYLDWGKEKVAAGYMQEAYYCYARWGAKAKTEDLEHRYPQLLRPIFLQARGTINSLETLASMATPNISIHASTTASISSSSNMNTVLDFAAIIKASQSLSSTIKLDELLHQLTQVILQNSGGDRCALIMPHSDGNWQVKAIATQDSTKLCFEPLEGNLHLPVKLIQYVKNTQELVVIDRLKTDLPVIDEYLIRQQPKSILCLPILNQGKLIGILYLNNRSTSGVFTSDRLLILNFLCTQAAISLENVRLYQQAGQALQDLQKAQLQLVQSEKMFALGNLVAGVAHEINNPLGFISATVQQIKPMFAEMLTHLQLYQARLPEPGAEILDHAAEIDLDYSLEDLPKMIDSMIMASDRLKDISTSLRTFSRADQDYQVPFQIHEGINSTILILKHRLKANEQRPAIQVINEYSNLPEIKCFPGQLNQVFMNILANAIDALEESNKERSFADIQAHPPYIFIKTLMIDNKVKIAISDNGIGMTEEVKQQIFDHLFTTKAVGKGTGLGLAIARQIVVEKHHGSLIVNSRLGEGTEFVITLPILGINN